jgi:hypothetical protein
MANEQWVTLDSTYPPAPKRCFKGEWAGLTWVAIHREMRGEGAPRQMALIGEAA